MHWENCKLVRRQWTQMHLFHIHDIYIHKQQRLRIFRNRFLTTDKDNLCELGPDTSSSQFGRVRIERWRTGGPVYSCHLHRRRDHVVIALWLYYTHTHPLNGPLSRTTWVSRYQKGKTNVDFTEARDSEWQWRPLGHTQVFTVVQTDNHASTPPLSFFTGWMPLLPPNKQRQSTEGIVFYT